MKNDTLTRPATWATTIARMYRVARAMTRLARSLKGLRNTGWHLDPRHRAKAVYSIQEDLAAVLQWTAWANAHVEWLECQFHAEDDDDRGPPPEPDVGLYY